MKIILEKVQNKKMYLRTKPHSLYKLNVVMAVIKKGSFNVSCRNYKYSTQKQLPDEHRSQDRFHTILETFGDSNVECKRGTYDVTLASRTGA